MLKIKFVHLKNKKSFVILMNDVPALFGSYNIKYASLDKTAKLRLVFPYITVFTRCG
jgi:hypothetical protein